MAVLKLSFESLRVLCVFKALWDLVILAGRLSHDR
jgi:hypothetical protein